MPDQGSGSAMAPATPLYGAANSHAWEVKIIVLEAKKMNDPRFIEPLNELAAQGWEPVSMSPYDALVKHMAFYFKRPQRP